MQTLETPIETIRSKLWPNVTAEIYRDRSSTGAPVWRTKICSAEYPESSLMTQKLFETREQAVAHANVVLGMA